MLDDEEEGFDQSRSDEISDFTSTPPYKVGMDPHSWPCDIDFPFPEDDGDPDASAWCVWKGMPRPQRALRRPLGAADAVRPDPCRGRRRGGAVAGGLRVFEEDLTPGRGQPPAPPRQPPPDRSVATVGALAPAPIPPPVLLSLCGDPRAGRPSPGPGQFDWAELVGGAHRISSSTGPGNIARATPGPGKASVCGDLDQLARFEVPLLTELAR